MWLNTESDGLNILSTPDPRPFSVTLILSAQPAHNVTFQRCFKVDFRLRRWTTNFQRWNNVNNFNVGKTTHFQRWNHVRFQRWNNVRFQRWNNVGFRCWNNVIFQHWNNVRFQRWNNVIFSTLKQRHISMLKQRYVSMLKQCQISTLIRLNKIECLFNVEVRRCFNVVSTCICLLDNTPFLLYARLVGTYYGMARASVRPSVSASVCLWFCPQSL